MLVVLLEHHIYILIQIVFFMDLSILKETGLSEGELKVYKILLEIGTGTANQIHEKVGVERRNIYDILNKLIEKGLVSYIEENGKKSFKINSPERIINYLEEKRELLEQTKNKINKILPFIEEQFNSAKSNLEVFRGENGIKSCWEDMLKSKNIYWTGAGNYVPDKFPAFFKNWTERRIKAKVSIHYLFRNDKIGKVPNRKLQFTKYLPNEFNGNPTATCVWGNKVGHFLFGEELFAFVIESKELAENYKKYFDYLWKISKN